QRRRAPDARRRRADADRHRGVRAHRGGRRRRPGRPEPAVLRGSSARLSAAVAPGASIDLGKRSVVTDLPSTESPPGQVLPEKALSPRSRMTTMGSMGIAAHGAYVPKARLPGERNGGGRGRATEGGG